MLSRDVAPTRLGAAKAAAQAFLDRAPAKLRVGLVTFAGDVSVAAAPTHDRARVRRSVAAITRWQAGGGTAIGDALARSVELARDAFAEPGTVRGAGSARDDQGGGRDPVPLRRASEPWTAASRGGRRARGGGRYPGLHRRARHRSPGCGLPAVAATGASASTGCLTAQRSERSRRRPVASTSLRDPARALESAYGDLGTRLGRVRRPTEVTALFVAAGAVVLAAAAALGRLAVPGVAVREAGPVSGPALALPSC